MKKHSSLEDQLSLFATLADEVCPESPLLIDTTSQIEPPVVEALTVEPQLEVLSQQEIERTEEAAREAARERERKAAEAAAEEAGQAQRYQRAYLRRWKIPKNQAAFLVTGAWHYPDD